ncbi:MAG: S8 family serine peptidase, partial [Polyangiaceae bacterium]
DQALALGDAPHLPHVRRDSHGHRCTAIAAGSIEQSASLRGVAPGADIIYVNLGSSGTKAMSRLVHVAEGLEYIFRRAGDRPCSVSLSIGDGGGPHDGTSPLDRFVDTLLTVPGRSVSISTGNDDHGPTWSRGSIAPGERAAVEIRVPERGIGEAIEIWYTGSPLDLEIVPPHPTDKPIVVTSGLYVNVIDIAPEPATATSTGRSGAHLVVASRRHPVNKRRFMRIEMLPLRRGGKLDDGTWTLRLTNRGRARVDWRGWMDGGTESGVRCVGARREEGTLSGLASGRRALTVGGYSLSFGGQPLRGNSLGPTADGREKPELLALGENVRSPTALVKNRVSTASGSSMATPQVAGAAALLFSAIQGSLSQVDVRFVLRALADRSGLPPGDPRSGWGRLRVGPLAGGLSPSAIYLRKNATPQGKVPCATPSPWTSPDIRVVRIGDRTAVHVTVIDAIGAPVARARVHLASLPLSAFVPRSEWARHEIGSGREVELSPNNEGDLQGTASFEIDASGSPPGEQSWAAWVDVPTSAAPEQDFELRHDPRFAVRSVVTRPTQPEITVDIELHGRSIRRSSGPVETSLAYVDRRQLPPDAEVSIEWNTTQGQALSRAIPATPGAVVVEGLAPRAGEVHKARLRVRSSCPDLAGCVDVGQAFDGAVVGGARLVVGDGPSAGDNLLDLPHDIFDFHGIEAQSQDLVPQAPTKPVASARHEGRGAIIMNETLNAEAEREDAGEQFQMERGIFDVLQGGTKVGELFVIGTIGDDNKIEYWYLFNQGAGSPVAYIRPGRDHSPQGIEYVYRGDSNDNFKDEAARNHSTTLTNQGIPHVRIKAACTRQG